MYGLTLETPELQKETKDLSEETGLKTSSLQTSLMTFGACTPNAAILKQVRCFDSLDSLG